MDVAELLGSGGPRLVYHGRFSAETAGAKFSSSARRQALGLASAQGRSAMRMTRHKSHTYFRMAAL
jgi:hypothetical protein